MEKFTVLIEARPFCAFDNTPMDQLKDSGMNREHLERIFHAFRDYPLALEVRHGSWNRADFYLWLQSNNVGFCNIDQPVINDSLSPTSFQTHPVFTYVRLHGRNVRNWFRADAGRDARYDYLYAPDEIRPFAEMATRMAERAREVIVVQNNHFRGQAVVNAMQMAHALGRGPRQAPQHLVDTYPQLASICKTRPETLF